MNLIKLRLGFLIYGYFSTFWNIFGGFFNKVLYLLAWARREGEVT